MVFFPQPSPHICSHKSNEISCYERSLTHKFFYCSYTLLGPFNILCVGVGVCVGDINIPQWTHFILHRQVFQDIVGLSVITSIQR